MNARTALLLALTSLVLQLATPAVVPDLEKSENGADESERIIRGRDATGGQFPWAAALYRNGSFICTCSVIGSTSVLTAAHCVTDKDGVAQDPTIFHAIAHVNKTSPIHRLTFVKLYVHDNYKDLANDIAIFRTTEHILFDANIQPICMARENTPMNEYTNATAMGWGNTSPFRVITIIPETLQHVEQQIVDNRDCPFLLAPGVSDDRICATGFFTGVCNGDSGGPLVHLSSDKPPVQIGITSYGNAAVGCGKISPAVFTRVGYFTAFIRNSTVEDSSVCYV